MSCSCGRPRPREACCGPLLSGAQAPLTAEDLMRSRYSAFVDRDVDYLMATHDPDTIELIDREALARWAESARWVGLEVVSTERGGPDDRAGVVEFVARYETDGAVVAHHERSSFRRIDGRWFYVDGVAPERRTGPRVGRNDPCPCGSGKKHKKCCAR